LNKKKERYQRKKLLKLDKKPFEYLKLMITFLLEPKTSNIAPKFEEFFKDSSINK
jgi:hypothetical protein